MRSLWTSAILATGVALAATASAHTRGLHEVAGPLVSVAVEVGGHPAHLYHATDGSGRYYLEAREGSPYVLHLTNRTRDRLGVVVTVDGLNAISGQRDRGRGRMYVLRPWQTTTVRGWRASLDDVRRFTFVDEKASYAARSGKANSRMGWIEMKVFREKVRFERRHYPHGEVRRRGAPAPGAAGEKSGRAESAGPAEPSADMAESEAPQAKSRARSYPGTGWGSRAHDPVVVVDFDPARRPAQSTTLRYEYRGALVALGILPSPHTPRDRLAERDRGDGFAPPPLW